MRSYGLTKSDLGSPNRRVGGALVESEIWSWTLSLTRVRTDVMAEPPGTRIENSQYAPNQNHRLSRHCSQQALRKIINDLKSFAVKRN